MSTVLTPVVPRSPTAVYKTATLKDGRDITIRTLRPEDVDHSLAFFRALPDEDRRYLRVDVTKRELVERRIAEMSADRVERLVAVEWNQVLGDGALEVRGHGWGENVGEIRLIVARHMQRRGLGTVLARELFLLAIQHDLDRIVARVMAPQGGARRILHRLGFEDEVVVPQHVRDQAGEWQDLIILRCNIDEIWDRIQDVLMEPTHPWPR